MVTSSCRVPGLSASPRWRSFSPTEPPGRRGTADPSAVLAYKPVGYHARFALGICIKKLSELSYMFRIIILFLKERVYRMSYNKILSGMKKKKLIRKVNGQ